MKNKEIHLGMRPLFSMESNKDEVDAIISSLNMDILKDTVRFVIEQNGTVNAIEISTQKAISMGFINPYALKIYLK